MFLITGSEITTLFKADSQEARDRLHAAHSLQMKRFVFCRWVREINKVAGGSASVARRISQAAKELYNSGEKAVAPAPVEGLHFIIFFFTKVIII